MLYTNARIYGPDFRFHTGSFSVTADGRFSAVQPDVIWEDAIDLQGATVIPGLVDVHIHGAAGADFSDGDPDGLAGIGRYLAGAGVTSFAPASMTLPYEVLKEAFASAEQYHKNRPHGCSRLMGIQMEGPYFSEKKKGAQNGAYLKNPDFDGFKALYDSCGGLIRIADIAPELPGAIAFIKKASSLCTVSVAHTDAGYDHAREAFAAGATHLTHLYNAMPGIHHRNPGVIPAAVENPGVRAEIICDGQHVHPASVRLAFSMFGPERMILVSDGLRCMGLADGEYALGGQRVFLKNNLAKLADGTIAGSATDLFLCLRNAMAFGIPEEAAIRAATYNPACALGVQDQIGTIQPGKFADFLICSPDYTQKRVFINGKEL